MNFNSKKFKKQLNNMSILELKELIIILKKYFNIDNKEEK